MKKSLVKIFVFVGLLVMFLGVILDPIISEKSLSAVVALLVDVPFYIALSAVLAAVFVYSKNNLLANVGYGLAALVGVLGILLIVYVDYTGLIVIPVGMIIMFVGALLKGILIAIEFFGYVKSGTAQSSCDAAAVLVKYKELEKEGVLSEEEFSDLKNKTIAAGDQKVTSFDDLKKWKKLLDQNVITEEEFAALKSKLFAK